MKILRDNLIQFGLLPTVFSLMVTACGIDQANTNYLAVGKLAAVHHNISFPPNGLRSFSGFKKTEILTVRSQAVLEHPDLVKGSYTPSESIFGQLVDGRPWWGLQGVAFFGSGANSSRGQSWHSQQICNPFALVVADIFPLTYHWDRTRFADMTTLAAAGCPTRCQPSEISINPDQSQGGVTYNVGQYLQQVNMYCNPGINPNEIEFELLACNARDFGYNYLYVDSSKSSVVCNDNQKPVHIVQFFHCGGSCGIPGGCNNMSPKIEALENFKLTALPARCHILLWKNEPGSPTEKPDFTFDIDFK